MTLHPHLLFLAMHYMLLNGTEHEILTTPKEASPGNAEQFLLFKALSNFLDSYFAFIYSIL